MLRIARTGVEDGVLRIVCEGVFGIGSEGNPSGHPIKDCIRAALERETLSGIVIDFQAVDYEWSDAPAWSILDALKHRVPVTYLCSSRNFAALEGLFAASGLRALGEIRVVAPDET